MTTADPSGFADVLTALIGRLDRGDFAVEHDADRLQKELGQVVPSALGFTLAVETALHLPIRVTRVDAPFPEGIGDTVRLALPRLPTLEAEAMLTCYATRPGTLTTFGRELAVALGLPAHAVVVDVEVAPGTSRSGIVGLTSYATLNRALDVLVARGMTPDEARDALGPELRSKAANVTEAVELIAEAETRPRLDES